MPGSTSSRFCKRQHSKIVTIAPQGFARGNPFALCGIFLLNRLKGAKGWVRVSGADMRPTKIYFRGTWTRMTNTQMNNYKTCKNGYVL